MDLLLPIGLFAAASIWHVGSGMYLRNRWEAQNWAIRYEREKANRLQKELNKQIDDSIKRQLRNETIIDSYIEKKVKEFIKKETAKS